MRNLPPGHSLGPRSGLRDQGRDVQSDCSRQWRRELNRAAAIRWRDRRKVERGLAYPVREIAKQYKRAESTISDVVHRRTYVRVQPGEVAYVPGAQERKYQILRQRLGEQQRGRKRK